MIVAGIMSGTSLDGITVALVEIRGKGFQLKAATLAHATTPYTPAVREALLGVSNRATHTSAIGLLHFLLPELYAKAVRRLSAKTGLTPELVGCHGQTILHIGKPVKFLGQSIACTLQIGDGSVLAQRLGVPVVCDFRPADMAAGGQGAPLVPFLDYLLLRDRKRGRIALNLGGIGNLTAMPPGAGPEAVIAFDTGPANMVMDQLVTRHTAGKQLFDRGAKLGRRGTVNRALLAELLDDPFYRKAPPKSAGREQYGHEFVERLIATNLPIEDLVATSAALTAAAVGVGVRRFVAPLMPPDDLIVAGGGALNPLLMEMLAAELPATRVETAAAFGIDVEAKEALAFAVLAYETYMGRPSNVPSATGAARPVVLGKICPV